MNKQAVYHAIIASGYIATLVSFISWLGEGAQDTPDNIFMPMMMLALLVLSVSIMAFLFFYEPVIMIIEKRYGEAVNFFTHTVLTFALITIIFSTLALFVIPTLLVS